MNQYFQWIQNSEQSMEEFFSKIKKGFAKKKRRKGGYLIHNFFSLILHD